MKIILNKKSFMKFGEWSLIIFSLVLFGFFIVQYVIPILALNPPTLDDNFNVSLSTPVNGGYSILANTNFTFNASWNVSYNLANCTLWGNFSGTFAANATNATQIINNAINGITTSVTDGLYSWNVYCYNATSHGNYSSANYTVKVDLTNPVLNNPYPANNSYINNANVVFNISLTEQNIDYTVNATLSYRRKNLGWYYQTLKCWNGVSPFTCNFTSINLADTPISLTEGEVLQFFYNTTDAAGRTGTNGTLSDPLNITLDTTQPTSVTGLAHSNDAPTGYDNDTTLAFTWTAANDGMSGVKQYKIYVRENSSAYVYNGTNSTPLGYSFTGGNGNTYSINVTTVDNANNENTTGTVSSTITVDITQPSSPGNVYFNPDPTDSYDNDETLVINWTVATDANGILNYKIYVSENNGAYRYNGTNSTPLGYSFTGGNGNNYTVNVTALDNAGIENTTGTVSNTTIYVDTTAPNNPSDVAFKAGPTTSYDNDGTLIVNWTAATDAASGIQYYKIYVWTDRNSSGYLLLGNNNTPTGYSFAGVDGHNYSVNVTAVDNVNNWNTTGATSSTTITVDTTQPSSPTNVAFQADPTTTFDDDETITVTWGAASDANGILNYKIYVSENNGAYRYNGTNSTPLGYSFTGGNGNNYTVNVTANDTAYNENTTGTVSSTTITVDTTQPIAILTVSPTLANESYTSKNWAYVNVTFTETNPNTCLLQFNNGTASNYTMTKLGTNCNINMTSPTDGAWNYNVFVNDSANNWGTNGTYYVTVDTVNPVINETVPANGSYFKNPSSATFSVKLTEQNKNNSINATVYYRRQNVGSYQSSSLKCYGIAPTWTCNVTGIDTGLGNGDVMQFLFNTTDSAGKTGVNGTVDAPLTATVDIGAPIYTNNATNATVAGKNDTVLIYAYWTDSDTLNTAVLETNETGTATNKTTIQHALISSFTGSAAWSNFTWSNSSVPVGTSIAWKIYANDSTNNQNVTTQGIFSIDNTKPTYSGQTQNVTNTSTIVKGAGLNLTVVWSDNVRLSKYWASRYNSTADAWLNDTPTVMSSNNQTDILIGTSSYNLGDTIRFKIYANDTSGNEEVTNLWQYTIENAPPTYSNNDTNVTSGSTIVKGTPIAVYALWTDGIQLGSGWVQENITSPGIMQNTSITLSGNWTNKTFTTSSLNVGLVYSARLFANDTSGNENYTYPTWTWTIDGTAPTYANQSDSVSGEAVYTPGKNYTLNISWTDNLGNGNVSTVLLNFSSLSTNQTATSLGSSNYTYTLTDLGFGNYTYRWYANDTSGNWNLTTVYALNITQNTTTSSWMNLTMGNGTTVGEANNSLAYPNINNATGYYTSNVFTGQTIIFTLYRNDSVFGAGTSNPISDTTRYGVVTYKYTYNTSGNANYSTASKQFWLNVVQNNTNPINITIQNSTAVYYNSNVTESAGRSITVNTNALYGNETELKLYSNDSGNEAQVAVPYTFTPISAKIITLKANLTSTNYTTNQTDTYYLTITEDTTPPTILLFDYTNGTIRKSGTEFTLNISVTDGSGINVGDTCNVTISGTINRTLTYLNGWCSGTILTPNVPTDGNYTINITVRDNSTNKNEGYNSSFVLTVDNTTSVVSISSPSSGQYIKLINGRDWINGTVYDLIAMGSGNITTNNSAFTVYSFNGTNNTAFTVANNTAVSDGYVAITVYYNDSATNTGSVTIAFYIDNTPPTSFTALTTGTKTKSSSQTIEVNVTDNSMTNVSIFLYYKRGSLIDWTSATMTGAPAASTIYSTTIDTSMLGDGEYVYYYVIGTDNATNPFSTNNGSATSPLGYFKVGDTTLPQQPTGLAAVQVGSTRQVNITWIASASSDATGYYVYRDTGIVTTSSTNLGEAGNTTKFTDTVPADGTWNYTIVAHDAVPNVNTTITAYATAPVTTTDTTAPQQPTGLAAVQVGSTRQVNITWIASASSDATGYYVYRDTGIVTTSSTNLGEAGNTTKFTDTVPADGTWNYTIVAHDAVPNVNTTITAYATAPVTTTDTTAPQQPTGLAAVQFGSTKQINISWSASASSDVVRYNIYYKLSGALTTSDNSFSVGNVTKASIAVGSDGNWNFTVTAIDSSNNENTTIAVAANITIDTTAPSVTNSNTAPVKNSNGKTSDNTPTIVVNISETGACRFDIIDVAMSSMTYEMSGSGTQNHNYTITTALNDSTYTYYIRCNDTAGNTMTISATLSFILDTTGNFNYTQTLIGWDDLWIPPQSVMEGMGYSSAATNAWNISYVLSTTGGLGTNYNIVYYYNGSAWASFRLGSWTASSLQYMNNTNDKPYWINMTTTDRFEI